MLRDIELEDNEAWNIERLALIIYSQKFYFRKNVEERSKIQKEESDLKNLIKKAIAKHQWRVALLLLTSPCVLSPEFIDLLAPFKHLIISTANLKTTTSYGQYIITSDNLSNAEYKSANLFRLAGFKTGFLTPRVLGYISQKPVGALGKIHVEIKAREESEEKLTTKNLLIANNIMRCAEIDASTGSALGEIALKLFQSALKNYLLRGCCWINMYNPLLSLFEVVMWLMDKGYNKPLQKKDQQKKFHALKIFLDSLKVSSGLGCYRYKYGVHIALSSNKVKFLSTIFHKLTHALCYIMYNSTPTRYRDDLTKLAKTLEKYNLDKPGTCSILNFLSVYSEDDRPYVLFPRLVEIYIQNPDAYHLDYPYEILVMINHLFSEFIRDIAEFKLKLIELQAENTWSRVAISKALEDQDYKTYFSMVTTATQSSINEWPQFRRSRELASMAVEKGFSIYSLNKFKKNILQMVLEDKHPDLKRGLDILEIIWETKGDIPKVDLNVCNKARFNLLVMAIIHDKNPEFIKWLIVKAGVEVNSIAKRYAKLNGLEDIEELIEHNLSSGHTDSNHVFLC